MEYLCTFATTSEFHSPPNCFFRTIATPLMAEPGDLFIAVANNLLKALVSVSINISNT
jgi:hypothetical protein